MNAKKPLSYHCPNCKTIVRLDQSNPFRPFCSDRCKTIDLGAWASESYKVPSQEQNQSNDFDFDEDQDKHS